MIPELEKRVRWAIDNAGKSEELDTQHIQLYFFGTQMSKYLRVTPAISSTGDPNITKGSLNVDIHNSIEMIIKSATVNIAMIAPNNILAVWRGDIERTRVDIFRKKMKECPNIILPDYRHMHLLYEGLQLFPGEWIPFYLEFNIDNQKPLKGREIELSFRIFSEYGSIDTGCLLVFDRPKSFS